eukprot:scaffold54324_cov37-Prasinocladus_malaysianus.AAC.2
MPSYLWASVVSFALPSPPLAHDIAFFWRRQRLLGPAGRYVTLFSQFCRSLGVSLAWRLEMTLFPIGIRQDYKRRELVQSFSDSGKPGTAFGALLFACNGRGMGLFQTEHHDSRTFSEYVPVGVSGMFCNGEIGQVGDSTYLHGFTSVFGILKACK